MRSKTHDPVGFIKKKKKKTKKGSKYFEIFSILMRGVMIVVTNNKCHSQIEVVTFTRSPSSPILNAHN